MMMTGHVMMLVTSLGLARAGLLGAGTGEGSCAAPPFRAYEVQWSYGCPAFAPCCSEFGFCRPLSEWEYGEFRDCNGVSNGTPLPPDVIAAEEAAGGAYSGGKPAGEVGPPPEVIKASHAAHGELAHAVAPHRAVHHAVAAPHHSAQHAVAAPHHAAHFAAVAPHHAPAAPHHAVHHASVLPPHPAPHHTAVSPHHAAHAPIIGPHPAPVVPHPAAHAGLPHHGAHHAVAPLHAAPHHAVSHGPAPVAPISPLHRPVHPAPSHAVHNAAVHGLTHSAHAVHGPAHAVHGLTHTAHPAPHHAVHPAPQHVVHSTPHHTAHPAPHHAVHPAPQHVVHSNPHHAVHSTPHHAVHSTPHHAVHSTPHHAVHGPALSQASHSVHTSLTHQAAVAATHFPQPVGPTLHLSGHGPPAPGLHHGVHHPSIGPLQQVLHGAHHTTQSAQLRAAPQSAFVAFGSEPAAPAPAFTTPAPLLVTSQEEAQRSSEPVSRPGPRTLTPLPPQSPDSVVTPAPSPPIFSNLSPLAISPAPLLVTTLASAPLRSSSRGQLSASRQPKLIDSVAPSLQNLQQSAAVQSQAATQPRVLQSVVNNLATSPTSAAGPTALSPGVASLGVAPQFSVPSSLPISVSGDDSRCLHPKGSGSYTCLSFGAPHKPIFAFHTVQDEDGVVFGTGSGFPDQDQILREAETGVSGVRKIRKVLVSKDFIQKEFGHLKLFNEEMRRERARSFDFNSPKRKRMVTYPTLNGLPLTAYQEKLLRDLNYNQESSQNILDNEEENVQIYEYPL